MKLESGGSPGCGIEIRTELVASDAPIDGGLDRQNSLRRDAALKPFGNGLRGHADATSELGLRDVTQDGFKGTVVHLDSYIHSRLIPVNRHLIEQKPVPADHKVMVDTPRPEHYPDFKTWLQAALDARGLKQNEFAVVADATPQAVGKWLKGGKVNKARIQRIATWAGCDYMTLRMLLDGKISEAKRRAADVVKVPNWRVQRIIQKAAMLAGDDTALTATEAVLDSFIDTHAKSKKPA